MNEDLQGIIQDYICDFNKKKSLTYVVDTMPVVWFGDIEKYEQSKVKVVTVGINPSSHEFPEPPECPRFSIPTILNANELYNTNNEYFIKNPYKWFNRYERIISDNFDCSYGGKIGLRKRNIAIHIDAYSAIATNPFWGKLTKKEKETVKNTELFNRLLAYLKPDVILFSANEDLFNELFSGYTKNRPDLQYENHNKRSYIRTYSKDGTLLFWGRNHGDPFDHISIDEIKTEIDRFKENGIEKIYKR